MSKSLKLEEVSIYSQVNNTHGGGVFLSKTWCRVLLSIRISEYTFFPTNPSPTWVIDSISEVPPTDFISDAWLSDSFCFCCCIWLFETKTSTVSSCLARYSINCSFSSTISTTTNHHLYTRFCDSRPYHTQASLDPQFSPLPPLPFLPSLTPNFLFSISLTFSFPQNPARSPWNALWQDLKN